MSATNSTPIINLPLFIGTDKPAWLTDWNGAMNIIDTAIANLQTAESGTATSLASLAQSVEALSGTVSQHTTAIQTVTEATTGNTGSINTINSLIGNGQPTTTDKTIIGAINEINAKIPEGGEVAADDVTYDNQTSGLQATDVQAAIDEVNAKIVQSESESGSNAITGTGTINFTNQHATTPKAILVSNEYGDADTPRIRTTFITAKTATGFSVEVLDTQGGTLTSPTTINWVALW